MPRRLRATLDAIWSLLAMLVFAIIAWGALGSLLDAWERNEFLPGYFVWPAWLAYLPIAIGSALMAVRLLHHAVMLARHGADRDVATPGTEHVE